MNRCVLNGARSLLLVFSLLGASAALAGPQEDFEAGERSYRAGDIATAMTPLKRAADAGHAPAQALFAYILDQAEFDQEAADYYRRAAEQENGDGQYGLGKLYAGGEGLPRDIALARQWFERAARNGHSAATRALAHGFMNGELGFKAGADDAQGLGWVQKMADQSYLPALEFLAKGYRSGTLGSVDVAQAERMEARIKQLKGDDTKKDRKRKR